MEARINRIYPVFGFALVFMALALLGVVAAPINSGGTAFRSAGLIVADFMKLRQGPVTSSLIQHPTARLFIYRLNSGNLLLVKHNPVDMRTGRFHLFPFISKGDRFLWSDGLVLDERPGVSYPDGQQTEDGTIYITYDFDRRGNQNILMTSFTEDKILSGSARKILEVFQRRQIISKGGGD